MATSRITAAMRTPRFSLEFFVEDDGRPVVRDWLRSLSLTKRQVLGQAMNVVLQELGVEVCDTQFGKQLGRGLSSRKRQNREIEEARSRLTRWKRRTD